MYYVLEQILGIDVKKSMKLCDYTKEEIEIINNKIYINIVIKNDDLLVMLIDECIKNFKYDVLAKDIVDIKNKNNFRKN